MKILSHIAVILLLLATACTSHKTDLPLQGKPKYLWFDAEANYKRFLERDSIDYYLDRAVGAGFNGVVVDVRPCNGKVLYKSEIMPQMDNRDWDYLQYFIDAAHKRGLKLTVGTTIFTAGSPSREIGPAYEDPAFDGRMCQQYVYEGIIDIREQKKQVSAFMNPAMPENQEYALSFVKEIVEKYDIDGYSLDYCRYPDMCADFSDFSRKDFEKYLGHEVENWPTDVYAYPPAGWPLVEGKYFRDWWSYRAKVICDFVERARKTIKQIKPDVEVVYWASRSVNGIYYNGQNWASPRHPVHLDKGQQNWCNSDYMKAGFADKIDVFMIGAYLHTVFGLDDPNSIESALRKAKEYIKDDCTAYGTIYALYHELNIEDAVYVCLRDTEGLMVFDICQVIKFDLWDDVRRGVERAEPEFKTPTSKN